MSHHGRLSMRQLLLSVGFLLAIPHASEAAPAGPASADQMQRWVSNLQTGASFKVRMQAAILLGRADDPRALEPLVQALGDDHFAVRGAACLALSHLNRAAGVKPLITTAATDEDDFVRLEARKALLAFDGKVALEPALDAASAADVDVRREAINVLAHLPDESARLRLVEALGDAPPIHAIAHDTLFHLDEVERDALLSAGLSSTKPQVRLGAAALLEQIATPRAVALLMDAYDQQNDNPDLRRALRDHLRAVKRLLPEHELLADAQSSTDRFVRARALKFLGVIGGGQATDVLITTLDSPDVYLRGVAALSLADAGDPRAIQRLSRLIEDQDNARIVQIVRNSIQILERHDAPLRN